MIIKKFVPFLCWIMLAPRNGKRIKNKAKSPGKTVLMPIRRFLSVNGLLYIRKQTSLNLWSLIKNV